MIRSSGIEPNIIHYLDIPPDRDVLIKLIAKMKITVRDLLRKNVEPYKKLELDSGRFTDTQLIYFMLKYPLLINRPIVVTPLGVKLCRPSELVLDILPSKLQSEFVKEDGEVITISTVKK